MTKAPGPEPEAVAASPQDISADRHAEPPDLSYLSLRASPHKSRRRLLETPLAGLTVGGLVEILEALDQVAWHREQGLIP